MERHKWNYKSLFYVTFFWLWQLKVSIDHFTWNILIPVGFVFFSRRQEYQMWGRKFEDFIFGSLLLRFYHTVGFTDLTTSCRKLASCS